MEIPDRGHALTIDDGWRAVVDNDGTTALRWPAGADAVGALPRRTL